MQAGNVDAISALVLALITFCYIRGNVVIAKPKLGALMNQ
jgi:hypothetical protein